MPSSPALRPLAVTYALSFASGGLQLTLTSAAMQAAGMPMTSIGTMWAVRSLCGAFAPPLWGGLADRYGSARPFVAAQLVIGALLLLALAHAPSPLVAIVLFGLYGGVAGPVGSMLDGMTLTALGQDKHRFGVTRSIGTIGFGVTALGSALLLDRHVVELSPQLLFPWCALLTFAGGVAVLFVPHLQRPRLDSAATAVRALTRPNLVAVYVLAAVVWCSHAAYSSFLMPLAQRAGISEAWVGASFTAAIACEVFTLRASGAWILRFGARRILVVTAVLSALRWLATAFTASPVLFMLLQTLHGFTFALFFATLVAYVAARVPEEVRQSAQSTLSSSAFGLGGAIGSWVVGAVMGATGPTDARSTWLVMTAIAGVGAGLAGAMMLWRRRPPVA